MYKYKKTEETFRGHPRGGLSGSSIEVTFWCFPFYKKVKTIIKNLFIINNILYL